MKNLKLLDKSAKKPEQTTTNSKRDSRLASKKIKKYKSKKHDLKKLAAGWNDAIFALQQQSCNPEILETRGGPLIAFAVMQSTGLRPDELQSGVIFHLQNGEVTVEIEGSKTIKNEHDEATRGIEFREITINPRFCQASGFLCDFLTQRSLKMNKTSFCFSYSKNTMRNLMHDLSKKYNQLHRKGKKEITITGYFFRHHMAASLKACKELTPAQRAQVMGHLSTTSIQSYASSYRSKSPIKPYLKVSTSQQPKEYAASNFLATRQPKPSPQQPQPSTNKTATLQSRSPSF